MDLILWRHAEAEEGGPDLERKLTPKGRKQAKRVAAWLLQRLPSRFALLSSPAVRASASSAFSSASSKVVDVCARSSTTGRGRIPRSRARPPTRLELFAAQGI